MPNVDVRAVWLACDESGVVRVDVHGTIVDTSMELPAFRRVEVSRIGDKVGVTVFGTTDRRPPGDSPVLKGSADVRWPLPLPIGVVYVGETGVHGRQELHYYDSCEPQMRSH
jgi:hypothetical protein